ncbi:hypothetical protein [Staphylococcus shinii]|uniref:hypothetical protein n=1 Tax=Staphylococcus shinii TaxID=2912228 RepID=UPI003F860590
MRTDNRIVNMMNAAKDILLLIFSATEVKSCFDSYTFDFLIDNFNINDKNK